VPDTVSWSAEELPVTVPPVPADSDFDDDDELDIPDFLK
jgi:hypothetical protein